MMRKNFKEKNEKQINQLYKKTHNVCKVCIEADYNPGFLFNYKINPYCKSDIPCKYMLNLVKALEEMSNLIQKSRTNVLKEELDFPFDYNGNLEKNKITDKQLSSLIGYKIYATKSLEERLIHKEQGSVLMIAGCEKKKNDTYFTLTNGMDMLVTTLFPGIDLEFVL